MVHPTKTDSELMTKQKENKTDFLLSPHSAQSITSTIAGQIRKQTQKVERRAWGKRPPKIVFALIHQNTQICKA